MKNYIFTFGIVSLFSIFVISCSNDDDNNFCESLDARKIDSIAVEFDTITLGQTLPIYTYSQIKRQCEGFYDYDYIIDDNVREVTTYIVQSDCIDCGIEATRENRINFRPIDTATYHFMFWNGTDTNGDDVFIEKNIVVE